MAFSCGGCPNTWTGHNRCHCSVCHNTFGGRISFDRHRKAGACLSPTKLGLENKDGVWKSPTSEDAFDRLNREY